MDAYAKIQPEEKEQILNLMTETNGGMMIREMLMEEGLEKGREEGREDTALNLLKMRMLTHQQIAQATNLPIEKIKDLARQLK
ncbi:MAG: hypothetical protein HQM14_22055 [SAR324 cluster bacterium]|nr:hypothetical protein [SAR324 cluster bacterium]